MTATTRAPRTPAQTSADVLCLVGTLALVLVPLLDVYGGVTALPALAGGLVLGTGVAVLSAARRWTAVTTVAVLVGVYVLAGGPLAAPATFDGLLPTAETARVLLEGPGASWKEVLTLQPPVGATGSVLVAMLLLALVGSAAALAIALRVRRAAVATSAALVPLAALVAVVVLGTRNPTVPPVLTGTAAVLVLLPWAAGRAGTLRPRRVVATGLLAAVAVGAGVLGAPAVQGSTPRYVVRDELVPPFDPRDYPSPLSAFREYVKAQRDTTLFTVEGLPADARVRLATMDRYDGVVWNVAGDGSAQASGEFRRVGDDLTPAARGTRARVTFTVDALRGVWLPTVGLARGFDVTDPDAAGGLRYNDATGGAVLTGGLHGDLRYSEDVVVPEVPEDSEIGRAPAGSVTLPKVVGAPDVVASTATDVARDAGSPVEIARTLAQWLSDTGYFSHGNTAEGGYPSLSGHGADRITALLGGDVMVGDDEQYASALALLAREMGLPARVVLGFVPPQDAGDGPVEITGDDVRVWVEIAFAGHGWVPFDATPPHTQTPNQDDEQRPTTPDPQVVQPPPPPPAAVNPPDEDTEQPPTPPEDDDAAGDPVWWRVAQVAGAAGLPLVLLAAPFVVVGLLKARRRRRRRRHEDTVVRVAGGWDEVLDAAHDLRHPVPRSATRAESARVLAAAFADAPAEHAARVHTTVGYLARSADHAVFGPGRPDDAQAAEYWSHVDAAVEAMARGVGVRRRWRARLSTASFRHRRAAARRGTTAVADRRPPAGHGRRTRA